MYVMNQFKYFRFFTELSIMVNCLPILSITKCMEQQSDIISCANQRSPFGFCFVCVGVSFFYQVVSFLFLEAWDFSMDRYRTRPVLAQELIQKALNYSWMDIVETIKFVVIKTSCEKYLQPLCLFNIYNSSNN